MNITLFWLNHDIGIGGHVEMSLDAGTEWSLDDELLKEIKMNRGHVDLRSDKLGLVARLSKSTSDGTVCPYVEGGSESEWYSCFL